MQPRDKGRAEFLAQVLVILTIIIGFLILGFMVVPGFWIAPLYVIILVASMWFINVSNKALVWGLSRLLLKFTNTRNQGVDDNASN